MNKETTLTMRKREGSQTAARERLLAHLARLLPDPTQHRAFWTCMLTPQPACLRLNPLMPAARSLHPLLAARGERVSWCPNAFALRDRESRLGSTMEFALGALYLQAKATTLAVEVLAPRPGERVLDLCAAPGGKATQIAARMRNTGTLVVNESSSRRLPALVGHLERCGITNALVSKALGTELARYFHNYFDRILVDAPCSGDGLLRKNARMLGYWSPADARFQAQAQTGLLRAAFHMLRPGGVLVYSTCSLSLEENEEVICRLLRRFPDQVEILPVEIFACPPLPPALTQRFPEPLSRCVRVWPHHHDTEGAFVARIGKRSATAWFKQEGDAAEWAEENPVVWPAARERIEEEWRFTLPCPPDHVLAVSGRHLILQPQAAAAFQAHYPFLVRSGMRVARGHKGHYYLTQQAVTMWGSRMQGNRLELDWGQVRSIFKNRIVRLSEKTGLRGEVLCGFGPWTLCRGIVEPDGRTLRSMLPREHCRPDLERLG